MLIVARVVSCPPLEACRDDESHFGGHLPWVTLGHLHVLFCAASAGRMYLVACVVKLVPGVVSTRKPYAAATQYAAVACVLWLKLARVDLLGYA